MLKSRPPSYNSTTQNLREYESSNHTSGIQGMLAEMVP